MATVINRLTRIIRHSVDTPFYSIVDYIIDPDLSQVTDVPTKYIKIVGDIVSEMDAAEKIVADEEEALSIKDQLEAQSEIGILKAIVAGLVKTMNIRLATNKITAAEIKAAIRDEL